MVVLRQHQGQEWDQPVVHCYLLLILPQQEELEQLDLAHQQEQQNEAEEQEDCHVWWAHHEDEEQVI